MEKKCNHKWQDYGAYKKCFICGDMILSDEMQKVNGIIYDESDIIMHLEDAEEHKDVPQ